MSGRPAKRRRHCARLDDLEQSTSQNDVNQSADDQKSKDEKGAGDSSLAGTCRLRHSLNNDCLCEVFGYLAVYDLIHLCELDVYYPNLITDRVIRKKLINFTQMKPCRTTKKIFEVFGRKMRKTKIAEENTLGIL